MRHEMRAVLSALLVLLAATPTAGQTVDREAEYIAARQDAVADLRRLSNDCNLSSEEVQKRVYLEDARLRVRLAGQLVALLGDNPPPGFAPGPQASPSILACGLGASGLDGLVYSVEDRKALGEDARVLVTTEGLLRSWISRQRGWRGRDVAVGELLGNSTLYTLAFGAEVGLTTFARLPVHLPKDGLAVALLVEESQSRAVRPPQRIAAGTLRQGRVQLAVVTLDRGLEPIEACETALQASEAQARRAYDDRDFDAARRIEADGERGYVACWTSRVAGHPAFPAIVALAQQLVDRLSVDRR